MPSYESAGFDPPAPVASVTLFDPSTGASIDGVRVLIDTGADVTLLPRTAVQRLRLTPLAGEEYELIGFDGTSSTATAVNLDVRSLRKSFRGKYLLIDREPGILGRDVLASLSLLLDGPRQEWAEHRL